MNEERSYVIGTHDAEIERLGVQHRVWRSSVLDFWHAGGLTEGMTVMDAGAGPGHATLDLAEIVGPNGQVVAVERSRRFVDALRARVQTASNIEAIEADVLEFEWPRSAMDRIWCRWVLAFVNDAQAVIHGMAQALKPGGALLIQEYYDYASWRMAPHSAPFEAYVATIIESWRATGGEPDIALALPTMLAKASLVVESVKPVVFAARMNEFVSRWPMSFARDYIVTMRARRTLSAAQADEIERILSTYEANPNALVITPGVLQIVARKPLNAS